ncbi:CDP-diacylglycerol--serine O-phosphatidyltransferase [Vineibacter terrae]|uniref:CDP-diacylglycerol--serine O-phosphatidyltransferase n=1 Tax=Vineibacter terrae TaxID=2586908 RepID=A0A5C8PWT2_9HYPH|nr:CDP-diacylglycerol--serine O-phosphatidyltransferase [Vineibacter terrae]TXL82330.1 CDP-diacylglycerol--serine O-phosphatidyltransferase [Vineibacter terrae]
MAGIPPPAPRPGALRGLSVNRLLPNALTTIALCSGLTAIRYGLTGDYRSAVLAVIVAAIFDALDGRVARRLNVTSRFGAELDSLSDFCAFGVAPALLVYLSSMEAAGSLGWVVTLMFPICSAMRLARFNVGLAADVPPPVWAAAFFTGVPAPVGALLVLVPLMLSLSPDIAWGWLRHPVTGGAFLIGVAALMVSQLPTYSFKKGRIPPHLVLPIFLGISLVVGLLATSPWVTLPCIMLLYLATLPLSWRAYRRLEATERAAQASSAGAGHPAPAEPPRPGGAGIVALRPPGGGEGGDRSRL